ncbi:MAG: hypothetical protein U0231_10535 [Nitrospiraceae bacterium]
MRGSIQSSLQIHVTAGGFCAGRERYGSGWMGSMFIDAREVEFGAVIKSDVCIVGGGIARLTLARAPTGGHRYLSS